MPARPGLVYVSDAERGIRSKGVGTGFSYRGPDGKPIASGDALKRIRSWPCRRRGRRCGFAGRTAISRRRGATRAAASSTSTMRTGARCATATNTSVCSTSRSACRASARASPRTCARGMPREKVLATVVQPARQDADPRSATTSTPRQNGSYGLTTLRTRHLEVEGSELRFHFKGKSGKLAPARQGPAHRPRSSARSRICRDSISSSMSTTRASARDGLGRRERLPARDRGRRRFGEGFSHLGRHRSDRDGAGRSAPSRAKTQAKMNVRRAIAAVAEKLGNTPTICRKCYIHPEIYLLPGGRAAEGGCCRRGQHGKHRIAVRRSRSASPSQAQARPATPAAPEISPGWPAAACRMSWSRGLRKRRRSAARRISI